jgi:hypothetical protein
MSKPKRPSKPKKPASEAKKPKPKQKPTPKAPPKPEGGRALKVIKLNPGDYPELFEALGGADALKAQAAGKTKAKVAEGKTPKRSAEWEKTESAHQDQLMNIMFDLFSEWRMAEGIRAEYLDLLMKVIGGRPHDDRMWQFILATHNSVKDGDLPHEDGVIILRQIHEHNSLYDPTSEAG